MGRTRRPQSRQAKTGLQMRLPASRMQEKSTPLLAEADALLASGSLENLVGIDGLSPLPYVSVTAAMGAQSTSPKKLKPKDSTDTMSSVMSDSSSERPFLPSLDCIQNAMLPKASCR